MVLITPDEGPTGLSTSIDALERQLSDMREDLEGLYSRIRGGELEQLKNASRATSEIRQWLKIAIEAEAQLEKTQKAGKKASFAITRSTSERHDLRSGAAWIVSEGPDAQDEFLDSLDEGELMALPYLFEFWALEHQLPPRGQLAQLADPGRARCGQDPRGRRMGARTGRRGDAARSGTLPAHGAGGRDHRSGARGDGVRRKRHPRLFAARPAAGLAGDAQAADLAQWRGGAGVFGT